MKRTRLSSERRRFLHGQAGATAQKGSEETGAEADVLKGAHDEL